MKLKGTGYTFRRGDFFSFFLSETDLLYKLKKFHPLWLAVQERKQIATGVVSLVKNGIHDVKDSEETSHRAKCRRSVRNSPRQSLEPAIFLTRSVID